MFVERIQVLYIIIFLEGNAIAFFLNEKLDTSTKFVFDFWNFQKDNLNNYYRAWLLVIVHKKVRLIL